MAPAQLQTRRVKGTPGNDVLAATADGQIVLGLAGHDILTSAFNRTTLVGGCGDDTLTTMLDAGGTEEDPVVAAARQIGGAGADTLKIEVRVDYGQITNVADGGDDDDNIDVSAFLSNGSEARNIALGGAGDDDIVATTDEIVTATFFRSGVNCVDGGSGNDTISARASSGMETSNPTARNIVNGGSGNDLASVDAIIKGSDDGTAVNIVRGGTGADSLGALARFGDNVSGSILTASTLSAINRVYGEAGDDELAAGQFGVFAVVRNVTFKNMLDGGTGNDTLTATSELDEEHVTGVESASVENTLIGGAGNDDLFAHARAVAPEGTASAVNRLSGGCGDDVLFASVQSFSETSSGLNILKGDAGDDELTAGLGAVGDNLPVELGSSRLFGGNGNDRLKVFGGSELNLLDGGRGCDELRCGDGDNRLLGGADADTFIFELGPNIEGRGATRLGDFNGAEDRLGFLGIVDAGAPGLQDDLDAITTVTDAGAGLDVTVVFDNGTTLVFAGVGTGSVDSIADLVDDPLNQLLVA